MSYRKQISYLELQENGQRIGSAGYARLESLDKEEILTMQLNSPEMEPGKTVSLYLQRESGEEPLCEIVADRGRASCEKRLPGREDREPILGIRIPLGRNLEIIGRFAGAGAMKKAPEPVTVFTSVSEMEGEIEEQGQDRNRPEQAKRQVQAEQQETPNGEKQTVTAAETVVANGKTVSGPGVQNLSEYRDGRNSEKTDGPADSQDTRTSRKVVAENTLHMKDTKWEQLSSIYPHIHPFRDAREFLSVGPEDFVVLRERCYQMTHNSFLLHGYYNYRHLLLMRQEMPEQVKYYIGVPGNFYEREKQVARMFGFESFEGTREPAWEGDFGYYLIAVEL